MAKFYQTEIQTMIDDTVAVGATATFDNSVDAQIAYYSNAQVILQLSRMERLKPV